LWLSPLWRGPGPLFEQTWIPFIQGWFVPSLIDFGPLVLEKTFFLKKKNSVYFHSFAIISSWRGTIPFLWTNFNPLPPRMSYAKSG
jgi:hypothetical protein